MITEVEFPEKLAPLAKPARYKIVYGGRGGAKTWSVARHQLIDGAEKPLRIGCFREFQKSIKESVHQVLADQVVALGLDGFYDVQATSIIGRNGTEFLFDGLRHNATKIKSLEGLDRAWIEQAERASKSSMEILVPTVRKEGSEIWMTLNPELEEDYVYQNYVVRPPSDAIVIKMDWRDNPWFPDVLHREMEELRKRDNDAWLNIWEGQCRHALEGAIYANELRDAASEGRICKVPYDRAHPVHTAWDLGHSDYTSIWCFQRIGFECRFLRYYQNNQQHIGHYLAELQTYGYVWGQDFLPHDAESASLASQSIADIMRSHGREVVVVPRTQNVINDINAARLRFSQCWFDQDKCADGLQCLRHYRYGVDEETGRRSRLPLHDWASDGADAFRTFAVGYTAPGRRRVYRNAEITQSASTTPGTAWMGA